MVGARSRPSGPGHACRLVGALITVVLGASFAQLTLPADASAQSPPLDCSGDTIYQIQHASSGSTTGRLNTVAVGSMSGTAPVTATQVTPPSLIPATSPGANALGITEGGQGAWALAPQAPGGTGNTLDFTLQEFDRAANAWTQRTASIDTTNRLPSGVTAAGIRTQGIVAGAVDPRSGNFFWAYLANAPTNAMVVFGFNTTTNQPIGVVANSTLPQGATTGTAGTNGDIAFGGGGDLFVVSNTGTSAAVGVIPGPLPTTQLTPTPTFVDTRLTFFENAANNSYNGIAFNSTGELFIQSSSGTTTTTIRKISPQDGHSIAGPSAVNFSPTGGGIGVDLGGCATPPTMELRKDVDARRAHTDQFHLSISGGDLTQGNTATTTGTATGVQRETAGPVVARAHTTYTFTETEAGTTDLDNYVITWDCVDQAAHFRQVLSGTGRTFHLTPEPGQAIRCTFTNSYPDQPGIEVEKTGQLDTGANGVTNVGDIIRYTITVRNTGNVTLSNVRVTERDLAGMSAIDCGGGTNVIAILDPGHSRVCTATYAVTQADIDHGYVPNFATATGTPPQGPDITDGDSETVPLTPAPAIEVDKTGRLDTGANDEANVGDTIHYTITVRNTRNVTLRNVTVTERDLDGLSAIHCGDGTNVIATLGVGEPVECTATYEVTQDDIDAGFVPNFATATGTPPHGPNVEDGDGEEVPITASPGIEVEKTGQLDTGANGVTNVGDVIHYTITVRNTGRVALRNVRVTERDLAGMSAIDCGGGTHIIEILRRGQSVECTATDAVTQADIDAGYVPNFATATGTPPRGPDVEDGDSETVPLTPAPAIQVDKTGRLDNGANDEANVGDTIHYTITVRNTGNVTLRNVTVTEQNLAGLAAIDCGGGTNVIATLGVGESVRCTATHVVTQADIDAGFVPNFATATGTPPQQGPTGTPQQVPDVENGDSDVESFVAVIALRKTARPSVVTRGSTVRFRLRVTNTSEVAAHNVRVCDTQPRGFTVASAAGFRVRGRTACESIRTLQPGSSKTLVFTARVGRRAPSRVTNTATATAGNAQGVDAQARVSVVGPRRPQFTG
jgi:uncharacterized repeat protein (TIGR01451 family)